MNNKILNEAFTVSKKVDDRGNYIAYIDPNKPENKETFKYKDIFKKHGAKWGNGFWYWYIGKTKDQWQNVYGKLIEPALKEVHKLEGAPEEDSKASLVASLDALISDVSSVKAPTTGEEGVTPDEKKAIVDRLAKFKETLVNLDNDEEFKNTMKTITAFKNSQGHAYSFSNTILIWIQNLKATLVKSEMNWAKFNRTIVDKKNRMIVRSPSKNALQKYSKDAEKEIINNFLKSVNKKSYAELGAGEKERLNIILRGKLIRRQFDFTFVYDVSNTKQIEGKENFLVDYEKMKSVKWFEENMISEKVRPIYGALMEFGKEHGVKVDFIEKAAGEEGPRGISKSGSIEIMKNEGNDVGITKTLAHEISHELLHQKYLKDKNSKFAQYFVGTSAGRDLVEQQAELSAWMVLASYGFDLKTMSLNYVAIWGADKEAMIRVFDTVTGVVNLLLDYINSHLNMVTENEATHISPAKHVTSMDVADMLGVKSDYLQVLNKSKDNLVENFYNLLKKL